MENKTTPSIDPIVHILYFDQAAPEKIYLSIQKNLCNCKQMDIPGIGMLECYSSMIGQSYNVLIIFNSGKSEPLPRPCHRLTLFTHVEPNDNPLVKTFQPDVCVTMNPKTKFSESLNYYLGTLCYPPQFQTSILDRNYFNGKYMYYSYKQDIVGFDVIEKINQQLEFDSKGQLFILIDKERYQIKFDYDNLIFSDKKREIVKGTECWLLSSENSNVYSYWFLASSLDFISDYLECHYGCNLISVWSSFDHFKHRMECLSKNKKNKFREFGRVLNLVIILLEKLGSGIDNKYDFSPFDFLIIQELLDQDDREKLKLYSSYVSDHYEQISSLIEQFGEKFDLDLSRQLRDGLRDMKKIFL